MPQIGKKKVHYCSLFAGLVRTGSAKVPEHMNPWQTPAGIHDNPESVGLYAAAGVSHRVGRKSRAAFDELLAGTWQKVAYVDVYMFCNLPISPYVVPDDPESGLLPEISDEPAGEPGLGDYKVQACNFQMDLPSKTGKVPFPKPTGYDPGRYALLARFMEYDPQVKWTLHYTVAPITDGPVQMHDGDSNNAGVHEVPYAKLRERLLAAGQKLD